MLLRRLRHIPGVWAPSDFKGSLREHTLAVRLYAVDAPETAKNGNPGQPFGKEAAKFVQDKLMNKEVSLKLLAKDQYGRALATVTYEEDGAMFMKGKRADISEELVKKGLAVVYRAGGAQYGGSIDKWNRLENAAKKQKLGIWSLSAKDLETPAEYKRRAAAAAEKKDKDKGVLKPSKRGIRRYQEVDAFSSQ
jgi:micrococcal nuclease